MLPVDSHCHLQDEAFDEDRDTVMGRSLDALAWFVVIGDDLPTSRKAAALSREGVYAAVGVHPYHAATVDDATLGELRDLASSPSTVAIGEIGLDYYRYNKTPKDVQHTAFRRQLDLAVECTLPVVIHNRESNEDLSAILDDYAASLAGGVMHCFSGDGAFAERCLHWNFYVSFAGNLTFPKAQALRDAARPVPLDRLLVETDSPYLAPQPVRGKRCEPAYVRHTAEVLAEVKGVSTEALISATAQNAGRLFNVVPARQV